MNWNLQSGVIIIGSLLWQDHLNNIGDNIRLKWRDSKLDLKNKIPVKIPIRYGRISKSGIPTMVYSNRMRNKVGFGYVVPFKSKINNLDELTEESVALSVAEGMKGNFVQTWGVLSYLLNEEKVDNNLKKEVIHFFKKQRNMEFDIDEYKVSREKSCLTKDLKLNINWLQPIDNADKERLNNFDFLLATATKPTNRLLTYDELAKGIQQDTERKYFINNLRNGIITQEDFEISKRL